jgi:prepilin-type N-terminal cleavage/methylation domain-containing protein
MSADETTFAIRRTGFTLVEVLATIMLMAIALPIVNKACVVAATTGNEARLRTEAASLARSKLSEMIAGYTWNGNGSMNGDFGSDRPNFSWQAKAGNWANDTQAVGLYQIDVTVSFKDKEMITVSSLAYVRPQPSS